MNRECGDCSECCTGVLAFEQESMKDDIVVATPNMSMCTKWCNGCTIYPDRPETCRNFKCLWLHDQGLPEWLKPNKCGFIITSQPEEIKIVQSKDKEMNDAYLLWAIWWALNNTDLPVILGSRKHGLLRYR